MRKTSCLKLMEEPLAFVIFAGYSLFPGLRTCLREAHGRPFHLLIVPNWEVKAQVPALETFAQAAAILHPGITVCVLSPGEDECGLLQAHGLTSVHAHHNAFIDERVFFTKAGVRKIYDAVHIAAMERWKRHELAWSVENLCLITYGHARDDAPEVLNGYKSLAYSNAHGDGSVTFLDNTGVAQKVNEAHAGLILSAKEGGNFASGEYLFCGVPVITTPSTGGRTYFLDEDYTFTVAPQAADVVRAVGIVKAMDVDAADIHSRAVARAIPHRERLLAYLGCIAGRNVAAEANANAWHPAFQDKLRNMVPVPDA